MYFSVLSNHTANNHYGRLELESPGYQTAASLQPLHENSRQEKIEVQILPQVSLRTIHVVRGLQGRNEGLFGLSKERKRAKAQRDTPQWPVLAIYLKDNDN